MNKLTECVNNKSVEKHTGLSMVFVAGKYWKTDGDDPEKTAQEDSVYCLENDRTVIPCLGI
jgi:hypothetical protein